MIKSVLVLALLCAPALADSSLQPMSRTFRVDFMGKSVTYSLMVADQSCGEVQVKGPQTESFLRVCARATDDGKNERFEIDRRLRDKDTESRQIAVVVANAQVSYDWLDGKITVKPQ